MYVIRVLLGRITVFLLQFIGIDMNQLDLFSLLHLIPPPPPPGKPPAVKRLKYEYENLQKLNMSRLFFFPCI